MQSLFGNKIIGKLRKENTSDETSVHNPDFDVSLYDVEDIITVSVGTGPVEGGDDGWVDIGGIA